MALTFMAGTAIAAERNLSQVLLNRESTVSRRVNGQFLLLGAALTLRKCSRDKDISFRCLTERLTAPEPQYAQDFHDMLHGCNGLAYIPKEMLKFLRRQFPEGSRIKLREKKNDPFLVKPGNMGTLTPEKTQSMIDDTGGQASHGFGESFGQREIRTSDGLEIYAHLWQQNGWTTMAEEDRFVPKFSQEFPDYCWNCTPLFTGPPALTRR